LNATAVNQANNGNTVGLISSYTTTDGKTHQMADVWLTSAAGTTNASTALNTINQLSSALTQYTASGITPSATNPTGALSGSSATPQSPVTPSTANTTAVLASALSQYNANGQLIASTAASTQIASAPLSTPASQLLGETSTTQVTITKNGTSTS